MYYLYIYIWYSEDVLRCESGNFVVLCCEWFAHVLAGGSQTHSFSRSFRSAKGQMDSCCFKVEGWSALTPRKLHLDGNLGCRVAGCVKVETTFRMCTKRDVKHISFVQFLLVTHESYDINVQSWWIVVEHHSTIKGCTWYIKYIWCPTVDHLHFWHCNEHLQTTQIWPWYKVV